MYIGRVTFSIYLLRLSKSLLCLYLLRFRDRADYDLLASIAKLNGPTKVVSLLCKHMCVCRAHLHEVCHSVADVNSCDVFPGIANRVASPRLARTRGCIRLWGRFRRKILDRLLGICSAIAPISSTSFSVYSIM